MDTTNTDLDFLACPKATDAAGDFKTLDEGSYEACLAAIVGKKLKAYQSEELEDKIVFTFQIQDDEGQLHYVSTSPYKRVISDKSNLFHFLSSWTKKGLQDMEGFNMGSLIGKPAQLVITHELKGDKTYLRIANVLAAKKNSQAKIVEDAAPAFITANCFFQKLADGITIKPVQHVPSDSATQMDPNAKTNKVDAKEFFNGATNQLPPEQNQADDTLPFNEGHT